MNSHCVGVTDQPRTIGQTDLLNTDPYAKGLYAFITDCCTPMSIALQGDWGSGKTSLLKFIKKDLKEHNIKTVFIETWQYSQMCAGDKLPLIFVESIMKELNLDKSSVAKKNITNAFRLITQVAIKAAGGNENALSVWDKTNTNVELVKKLRDEFQALVNEALKKAIKKGASANSRIVILVDDLDRLEPSVAVRLLEIIKLFMDVKNCVFVLAIDYDVVVQGVRSKFGQDFPLEKCRSFFDKIIQLPFHMPVETYRMDGMLKEFLGKKLDSKHLETVGGFATKALGANPRAVKRLVNSFLLLEIIQKELNVGLGKTGVTSMSKDNAILLCVLCLQIRHAVLYSYLSDTDADTWTKNGNGLFPSAPGTPEGNARAQLGECLSVYTADKLSERYLEQATNLLHSLNKVLLSIYDPNEAYDKLEQVVRQSAVTNQDDTGAAVVRQRDKTRYLWKEKVYPKNRLVLNIVKDYAEKHTNITLLEMQLAFPKSVLGKDMEIVANAEKVPETRKHRYFMNAQDQLSLVGNPAVVCSHWSIENINAFIEAAREKGYKITEA